MLVCIDYCKHQKETATGASAVAKTLGLDSYFRFMKVDAFELDLETNSVDVLWCDFGVVYAQEVFSFVIHTLTNVNTRKWLSIQEYDESVDKPAFMDPVPSMTNL